MGRLPDHDGSICRRGLSRPAASLPHCLRQPVLDYWAVHLVWRSCGSRQSNGRMGVSCLKPPIYRFPMPMYCTESSLFSSYKIPFAIQWIWPVPIAIGTFLAPESPWWCIRYGKKDSAMKSLKRLARSSGFSQREADATLACKSSHAPLELRVAEQAGNPNLRLKTETNLIIFYFSDGLHRRDGEERLSRHQLPGLLQGSRPPKDRDRVHDMAGADPVGDLAGRARGVLLPAGRHLGQRLVQTRLGQERYQFRRHCNQLVRA